MAISTTIARSFLALTLAAVPVAAGMTGFAAVAEAKGGNDGGNGGGNGGGHGGEGGKGGSHGSDRGKSSDKKDAARERKADREKVRKVKVEQDVEIDDKVKAPKLRSLNRNFRAYMNSNDPRMAGIAAYAVAYAEFEAEFGEDAVPTDPELSDEALRDALADFTKDGVVTDAMVDEAKSVLGVGEEVGKIDQIRETLPEPDTDGETVE